MMTYFRWDEIWREIVEETFSALFQVASLQQETVREVDEHNAAGTIACVRQQNMITWYNDRSKY